MFVGMERRFGFQHIGICAYCVLGNVDRLVNTDTGSCLEKNR